ncbi:TauD/TfdA family dioxygenase [Pseudomonas sp. WHRI 8519]|uniref:TauD/TfdA family dioxygenase n=1 Tax=Pseudomonas sp. WHRI 8519 TaxID=3162567 RepID=UPI0032EB529A
MPHLIKNALSDLHSNGWARLQLPDASALVIQQAALEIAFSLGQPRATRHGGALIDVLIPTDTPSANPRSLSARYGLSAFPWHTDGAHWSTPPRYLVMGCLVSTPSAAQTLFCEGSTFDPLNADGARSSLFRITNGGNSFYAAARGSSDRYYRFDPGCMAPVDAGAQEIMRAIDLFEPAVEQAITWQAGKFLLLDNWRFLHRRGAAMRSAERKLLRVTVMDGSNHG